MDRRVVVTGLGAVTPLGNDLATSWQAALRGECGIDTVTQFDASILGSQIAGEVKNFDATKYLGVKEVRRFDRFVHFGVAAGIMALEDAGIEVTEELSPEIGVAIGAGIGGIPVITSNYQAMIDRGPRRISPFMIPGCIINMVSGQLAIMKNLKGPNIAHVTACSTGLHAIGEAMHMIKRGDATVMVAGGCESTIHPLAMGAFDAMHALSRRNDDPKTASRPFDKDRDGLVVGEGAGTLVLESLSHAKARGARIYAEVLGFGENSDGVHITTPQSEQMGRAMELALEDAGIRPEDVDCVNGHGTATDRGDVAESHATARVFGDRVPYTTYKGHMGHTLGACGALEAIFALRSMEEGFVSPILNLKEPDPACANLQYVRDAVRSLEQNVIMSNNFAFGGINTSLVFRRWLGE